MPTTIPESHRDLLSADFATLATNGSDGRPQVSEIWFLAEGQAGSETIRISLNDSRQKTKNLVRDPRCTLFVLDVANPYRYLEIRGDGEIASDSEYAFADKVGAKYDSDLKQHDQPGQSRVVVTLRPTHVNAVDMSG